jgi:hypothetical protein
MLRLIDWCSRWVVYGQALEHELTLDKIEVLSARY